MAEDVKDKQFGEIVKDYFKEKVNGKGIFETVSAFAIGVAINVMAKGFSQGFSLSDIWSWSSLIVGFAAGLGIPAVQNDAIRKAVLDFITNNVLFIRYRAANILLSDAIINKDFRRFFIKKTNDQDLIDLKESEFEKQTDNLKSKITDAQSKLLVSDKKEKLIEQIKQMELELKEIEENGVDIYKLGWEPMEINDVFNFENKASKHGKKALTDNSKSIHNKKNWIARFYMPVIMMILQGSALAIIKENIGDIMVASGIFILILIYTWVSTKQAHVSLKEDITLPVEKRRNDLLKDAEREYKEWKAINEIEIDLSGFLDVPFIKAEKKDDPKVEVKKDAPKEKPIEFKILGTFGNFASTTKGDLPNPEKRKIEEGTQYICIHNIYSRVAKRSFKSGDDVVFFKDEWINKKNIKKETK